MDCSPPGSSVHGISQARILEWVAISFSRGSSRPRDQTCISCIGRRILYHWATWKAPGSGSVPIKKMCSSLPSPTTQVTLETRYCLYKIYHSDFVFTGNVNLCPLLPKSNSLPNHCLRKTHFLNIAVIWPCSMMAAEGAPLTSDLGLTTLYHLLPSSIPGGNWGTDANLSVWDYKTFGMGPYCRMGLAAEPSSRVLHLESTLRILVTEHDSWRLCKKMPGAFCVVAVSVVGLLRGLLHSFHGCLASLISWAWVMPNWSAALGISEARNQHTQQPWPGMSDWRSACPNLTPNHLFLSPREGLPGAVLAM